MAVPEPSLDYSITSDGANTAICTNWAIEDVTPPGGEAENIQTSNQQTTTAHTHKAAPLIENDDLVLETQFDPTELSVVGAANESWVLTCPDDSTMTFAGYVKSHKHASHTLNGKTMSTIMIKVSGTIAIA